MARISLPVGVVTPPPRESTAAPRISAAQVTEGRLEVELGGGAQGSRVSFPLSRFPQLAAASPESLSDLRVTASGSALLFKTANTELTLDSILRHGLGVVTATENARRARAVTSAARSEASRANGARGGRPKRVTSTSA